MGSTRRGATLGYCYDHVGLFMFDVWTWNGRPCLHDANTFWELNAHAQEAIALKDPQLLEKPLLYRFPLGLVILALGAAVSLGVGLVMQRSDRRRAERLLARDGRYRDALEALRLDPQEAPVMAMLIERGVSAADAKDVVDLLLTVYFDGGAEPASAA